MCTLSTHAFCWLQPPKISKIRLILLDHAPSFKRIFMISAMTTPGPHEPYMAPEGALDYNEFTRLIQRELSPAGSEAVPDKVVQKFWRRGGRDLLGMFGEGRG